MNIFTLILTISEDGTKFQLSMVYKYSYMRFFNLITTKDTPMRYKFQYKYGLTYPIPYCGFKKMDI